MTVAQQLADGGVVLRETVPSSDVVRARFGDVDGLRALAIVAIVAFQTVRFIGLPARTPPAVAQLFGDASQGFALFLMLSAFSLAYPILAARRTDGATYLDIGRYAVKRLLRIYPAFLAVLGIAFATHPLAAALHWTALANAVPPIPVSSVLRNAVFLDGGFGGFADGAGNDGFTALALVARGFILLPVALLGWLRAPRITLAAAILAAALDVLTPAHAFTLAAVLPLVLGIVAADMRVQHHRLQRFGLPLALGAAVTAFFLEPYVAVMAGTVSAPDALRVDPFWSIALFGLVAAAGYSGRLEGALGFPPLRLLGAAAYGISLVAMPVAALATRMLPERLNFGALAASTAAEEFGAGIVLWLAVDRWFAGDGLRRRAADGPGAWLDGILAKCHASRVVFAVPVPIVSEEPEPVELRVVPPPATFYAPPPRPATDIPVFSTRTGSADELAAEILQTKARLGELSAAVLDPEPRPPLPDTDPYAKPGFYRRPPQPVTSSGGRIATTAVAAPVAGSPVAASAVAVSPVAASAVAVSPVASPAPASASASTPVETPSTASGSTADAPAVDERVSSPAAVPTATAGGAATAESAMPTFDAGDSAMTRPAIDPEREEILTGDAPLRAWHAVAPSETTIEAAPTASFAALEPAPPSIADLVPVAPAYAAPVDPEVLPDAFPGDVWSGDVWSRDVSTRAAAEPVPTASPNVATADALDRALDRAVEPEPAITSAAGTSKAWTRAVEPISAVAVSADVRSESVAPLPAAPVGVSGVGDPVHSASLVTNVAEPLAAGPAVVEQPFPTSYDGESPLEMLRAAYPPIDEAPALAPTTAAPAFDRTSSPVAFGLSAEPLEPVEPLAERYATDPGPSLSASEEAPRLPWTNESPPEGYRLRHDAEPSDVTPPAERFVPGADRATPSASVDDRSADAVEASAAPVPLSPLSPLSVPPFPEPAIEPEGPGDVAILRPVVKASLLVRVFKHARAKFKPAAASAPGISASLPIPSGVQAVAAGRDASEAAIDLVESQVTRPVTTTNVPPRATVSAPPTVPSGRPSIRMRIGPSARISHPDGDNG